MRVNCLLTDFDRKFEVEWDHQESEGGVLVSLSDTEEREELSASISQEELDELIEMLEEFRL